MSHLPADIHRRLEWPAVMRVKCKRCNGAFTMLEFDRCNACGGTGTILLPADPPRPSPLQIEERAFERWWNQRDKAAYPECTKFTMWFGWRERARWTHNG